MPAAQRFFGSARQLLRVSGAAVRSERDLVEPLERALLLACVQLAVEGRPDGEAEHGQHGCQKGTAPAGTNAHAPTFPHGERRRKPPGPADSGTPYVTRRCDTWSAR